MLKKNVGSIKLKHVFTYDNKTNHLGAHTDALKDLSRRSHRVTLGQQPLGQVTSSNGARNHQNPWHNVKDPTFRLGKIVVKIGRQPTLDKKMIPGCGWSLERIEILKLAFKDV